MPRASSVRRSLSRGDEIALQRIAQLGRLTGIVAGADVLTVVQRIEAPQQPHHLAGVELRPGDPAAIVGFGVANARTRPGLRHRAGLGATPYLEEARMLG